MAHRRQDADDAMAGLARGDEALGDALQLVRIADGGAAELHHDRAQLRRGRVGVDGRNGLVLGRRHASQSRASVETASADDRKKAQKTLNRRTRGLTGSARQTYTASFGRASAARQEL